MITPELAARIVKDYLLPMFEGKPTLKKLKTENSTTTITEDKVISKEDIQKNKTISNEVKLTVRLNQMLHNTRDQLQQAIEMQEMYEVKNKENLKHIKLLKN